MTLEKARDLLASHANFGGPYNRHAVKLILAEVQREHGMSASDGLVSELGLERIFGFAPGQRFESAWGKP